MILFSLFLISCFAASGVSWHGTCNNIRHTWHTGTTLKGDYMFSDAGGYGNKKKVYARMGEEGTYSKWVGSQTHYVSVTDYGPFGAIGEGNYSHGCQTN